MWIGQLKQAASQVKKNFRHEEKRPRRRAAKDELSGLWNRDTVERSIKRRLTEMGPHDSCALFLVDLDDFKQVNDTLGLRAGDQILRQSGRYLSQLFRASDIVGRLGGDQFIVFLSGNVTERLVRRKGREICQALQFAIGPEDSPLLLSASAGIYLAAGKGEHFEGMYQLADLALYKAKKSGKHRFCVKRGSSVTEQENTLALRRLCSGEGQKVCQAEKNRPLTEGEKDVAFRCVSAMLEAVSLGDSVSHVLSQVGAYYQADRAYLLTLGRDGETLEMSYGWTNPQGTGSDARLLGERLDHIPVLQQCWKDQEPVCFTGKRSIADQQEGGNQDSWHFTAYPLVRENQPVGLFCLENPREHVNEMALLSLLMPYLLRERVRLSGDCATGMLDNMKNLLSYTEVVYSLTSEQYHSLGAVSVDIPNLSALNSSKGFAYGSKLLWYVAKTLTEEFGDSLLFRTWDGEFVAFCANIDEDDFTNRCSHLMEEFQQHCPKEVRTGWAWSDGAFSGRELTERAQNSMGNVSVEPVKPVFPTKEEGVDLSRYGKFTMFLQPQIDMATGRLVRAEALVRGVDESGNLVSPETFIREMERKGSVRDLDLFMLGKTLSVMERWWKKGWDVVPLAVNFSRVTLFDPSVLESMTALRKRYSHLPCQALELEITESAGSVEPSSLQEVMDQFRELGVTFALDDFGSQYANLSLFTNVRFDTVKLDRSLISKLAGNPINRTLVGDIAGICRTYGMNCVAEGVETKDQVDTLLDVGCYCGQGYFYDKPISVEEFEEKYMVPRAVSASAAVQK
ncbi:MAG: EAL domain-containing protein [Acutalibacter sp.]|jgi:diguanylate cyclase (GGDEF)-like protein